MGLPVASSKPVDSLPTPYLPKSSDRPGPSGSWFKRHDGRSVGAERCCLPTRVLELRAGVGFDQVASLDPFESVPF
jgi:hypothetical protein